MRSVQAPSPAEPRAAGDGCVCGHRPSTPPGGYAGGGELTERELASLTAIASGLTAKSAARLMGTSDRTLRRAQREAADRLGVPTVVQALVIAAATGRIDMRHVRAGTLPGWPDEHRPGPPGKRAQFVRLREAGVPVQAAADEVGVLVTTAWGWDQKWLEAGWEEDGG